MKHLTHIEPLEARIAPATILNPYTVTYQDGNGDTAVIRISKPLFASVAAAQTILKFSDSSGNSITENFTGNATAENLSEIYLLANHAASGMDISVKVIPQVGVGTLTVNVGEIYAGDFSTAFQATGCVPLGNITIQGNLGEIYAGTDFTPPNGVQSINVLSMNEGFQSYILGPVGSFHCAGNFNANLQVIGYQFGSIGSLYIGGTLGGDSSGDADTGVIQFAGHVGKATIGNITGTSGANTGELVGSQANPSYIGSLLVTGSITGGSGQDSGLVVVNANSGTIGKLTVNGSIVGGTAGTAASATTNSTPGDTGLVQAGIIGGVHIGGSLVGGTPGSGTNSSGVADQTADTSGAIIANLAHGITIVGNITGGGGPDGGILESSTLDGLVVDGSIVGGAGTNSGGLQVNSMHSATVIGSISGGSGAGSGVITGQSLTFTDTVYGTIVVNGSVTGGSGATSGAIIANGLLGGSISSLHIRGDLIGSSGTQSGYVDATGALGTVIIGGSVEGGSAGVAAFAGSSSVAATAAVHGYSGVIAGGSSNSIQIGGSVVAGAPGTTVNSNGVLNESADTSGAILVNAVKSLAITGNLTGGAGPNSGQVDALTSLGTFSIGGSVVGGTASDAGQIVSGGTLTHGVVGGSLIGNQNIASKTAVVGAGYIQAGQINSLQIKGSVTAALNSLGSIANSGAIRSTSDIVALAIGGAVTGNASNPVVISAQTGPAKPTTSDVAIQNVTIGGAATYLNVLAGYSPVVGNSTDAAATPLGTAFDGAAQIGTLRFGSTLSASNLVAGASPDTEGQFGTKGNAAFAPASGRKDLLSTIAQVIVTKEATGNANSADSFGFVAEVLKTIEINGVKIPTGGLVAGTPQKVNGNLALLEVAPPK